MGPTLPISQELHQEKYRGKHESFKEGMNRISGTLTRTSENFYTFRDILLSMAFMPAGRIQSAVGSMRGVTPYNCFVSGTIADSLCGEGSIMHRLEQSARTMQMGGGIGYDFSTLRPRGDHIRGLDSIASGPISFMETYDANCKTILSAGHRRGAQMAVLRVDHPDIQEFIHSKQNQTRLRNFNISVGITDRFMSALASPSNGSFNLVFEDKVYNTIDSHALWDMIMRSTYDWAEPGVLFLDTINKMNNLWYAETIATTNPCAEQPLPPFGACLLGSFNLVKYVDSRKFDYDKFKQDIHPVVEAMDRVVDVAKYPLREQQYEAFNKRRMGLGVTGVANALEYIGHPYGSEGFLEEFEKILGTLRDQAYWTSTHLAEKNGSFPLFDKDKYMSGKFIETLPDRVRDSIARYGIRNSHLLSIAPTGTISLCADNISSGIEPVFARSFNRTIQTYDGPRVEEVQDYGVRVLGVLPRTAEEVTVDEHLAVLGIASKYVDSAVSKTINLPSDISFADFKDVYTSAYALGAKGCTTFRVGGKRDGILQITEEDSQPEAEDMVGAACMMDENGQKSCEM